MKIVETCWGGNYLLRVARYVLRVQHIPVFKS
jgi:hypothetical protein